MEIIVILIAFLVMGALLFAIGKLILIFLNLQLEIFHFTFQTLKAFIKHERMPKYSRIGWFVALVTHLSETEIDLLNKYCPYYRDLSPELKKRFEKRLIRFKYEKDFFYTKESVKNKDLMITLFSAFAVQVTFGFKKFRLNNFHNIYIHPHSFSLEGYDWLRLSGFTAGSRGYIAFSETAFLKSIEYPTDGFNVALHEFAHAVDLSAKLHDEYMDTMVLRRWQNHASTEWDKLCHCNNGFLPEYAEKDVDEFYACAVERFFEQPEVMQERMNETFSLLSALLKQNPMNKEQPVMI